MHYYQSQILSMYSKLSDDYDMLRIETSSVIEIQNQIVSIDWSVGKDDSKNLSSIALRYNIANAAVDTEVIEGTDITNVRIGNVWYEGRDALPEYNDPFYEIARLASENPDGLWPPFAILILLIFRILIGRLRVTYYLFSKLLQGPMEHIQLFLN